jgi:hypothetical protein
VLWIRIRRIRDGPPGSGSVIILWHGSVQNLDPSINKQKSKIKPRENFLLLLESCHPLTKEAQIHCMRGNLCMGIPSYFQITQPDKLPIEILTNICTKERGGIINDEITPLGIITNFMYFTVSNLFRNLRPLQQGMPRPGTPTPSKRSCRVRIVRVLLIHKNAPTAVLRLYKNAPITMLRSSSCLLIGFQLVTSMFVYIRGTAC